MRSKARSAVLSNMRQNVSAPGYVSRYLAVMRRENPEGAELLESDIVKVFHSEEGLRVLKLLEKSTLKTSVPDGSDDRALRESNAVRNFVLELERIVSHGASAE